MADREHVERRLERVAKQAKSGDAALRAEVDQLDQLLAHVDAERPLGDFPAELPAELEPLTTKPLIVVVNGPEGIDAKLESELAELDAGRGGGIPRRRAVWLWRRWFAVCSPPSTCSASSRRARPRRGPGRFAAAGPRSTPPRRSASDIARGFIRCEVVRWSDYVEHSRAELQRRGLMRLEGKGYAVEDGDVLHIRFNV